MDEQRVILDLIAEGVCAVGLDGRITVWNAAAQQITGYPAAEVLGRHCAGDLTLHVAPDGSSLCVGDCLLCAVLADGLERTSDVCLRHCDGHPVPVHSRTTALRDPQGRVTGAVEVFSAAPPAGPAATADADLLAAGEIDPLTELGNRRFLTHHLAPILVTGHVGVLFIDVDHFKDVNDTYGHAVGDRVLRMVGRTLAHGLRASDTALRWGGEEFLAIVRADRLETVADVAERLRTLVANSWVDTDGGRVTVTISVGATLATGEEPLERAVDRADRLMYASKQAGRNRVTCRPAAEPGRRREVIDLTTTHNA